MLRAVSILILSTLFLSCDKNDAPVVNQNSGGIAVSKAKAVIYDVSYGDSPRHKMDVFLPEGRSKFTKIVILVPGGGWIAGDKENFNYYASLFSDASIAAITINYRYANIAEQVTYVQMLEDIGKAIDFLTSKSEEYAIGADQICLFGHSAGSHLALLYAYRNNELNQVNKVVSVSGATDLTDSLMLKMPNTGINAILDIVIGSKDIDKWNDASPINHANELATYLFHGNQDEILPYQQSKKLFDIIKNKNVRNKYVLFDGDSHAINADNWETILSETVSFIKE